MEKILNVVIRTPEKQVYAGRVRYIKLITEQGLIKILPNHSSLTGTIAYSPIAIMSEDGIEDDFVARRGLLSINNDQKKVDIMVFDCTSTKELNLVSAEEYLKFIETEIAKGKDLSDFKLAYLKEEKYVVEKQLKSKK